MKTKILQKIFVAPILALASLMLLSTSQSQTADDPGTYELSLCGSILYAGQELILHAYVADSSGNPATAGAVVFQFCSRGRGGFSRGQPSAACDIDGTARWASLSQRLKLSEWGEHCLGCLPNSTGDVCVDFGANPNPMTIGFRFKYLGQRSGIDDGISEPIDVTWLPIP
jgi:hypothetical protein